jgi:hypothetical protein
MLSNDMERYPIVFEFYYSDLQAAKLAILQDNIKQKRSCAELIREEYCEESERMVRISGQNRYTLICQTVIEHG